MQRLWAPWRMSYVSGADAPAGCFLCAARAGANDHEHLVLLRRPGAFLILNAFPYATGHVMAVVNSHVGEVAHVDDAELADAMTLVRRATVALGAAYRADGFNIGLNQGRVAGAGVPDHLHVHVVPRWQGDLNIMPVLADVRVMPETLERTWDRLRERLDD